MAKDKKKKEGLLQKLRGPRQEKMDPELQALLQEVQADPADMRARRKLADYYLKNGDETRALDQFLTVAETYAEKGFYPKAIAVYKQVLQISPNTIEVYLRLAGLYHKLGLMPEVVEQYQRAAAVYEKQGKIREALDIRRMMLDLDPANVVGRLKLGQQYLEKNFVTEAVAEFMRVANLFEEQGKTHELQKLLEGILDRGVENFDVLYRLIELYRAQGTPELALNRLARLSGDLAGSSSTLELTAEIAEELGKPAVAVRALERAADLYASSGRRDKVAELCRHILDLDDANAYARDTIAKLGPVAPRAAEKRPAPAPVAAPAPEPEHEIEIEVDVAEIEIEEPAAQIGEIEIEDAAAEIAEIEIEEPAAEIGEIELDEAPAEIGEIEIEESVEAAPEAAASETEAEAEAFAAIEEVALEIEIEEAAAETEAVDEIEIAEDELSEEEIVLEEFVVEEAPAPAQEEEEAGPEQIDLSDMSEEEAAERLDEAIDIYLKYNLRDKAVEYLNLALARNPESMPILEKIMNVHRDGGDEATANGMLGRLIELAQSQGRAEKLDQYLTWQAEFAPDDLAVARRLAEFYAAREPERAVIHFFDLANRYREADQFADAETQLARVLEIDPANTGAQQELLDLFEQTGQIDKAVDKLFVLHDEARAAGDRLGAEGFLRRVLEHRPDDERARERLDELFAESGETDKRVVLLRDAAERRADAGDTDGAIAYLRRWLALDEANRAVRARLKDALFEADRNDEAVAELHRIAQDTEAAGELSAAIAAWREALAHTPTDADARAHLCELYLETGDQASAVVEMMNLARAALEAEQLDVALAYLDRVLRINPAHAGARKHKVTLLRELDRGAEARDMLYAFATEQERAGDVEAAEATLRDIAAEEPDSPRVNEALKDLYLNAGKADKAVAILDRLAERAEAAGDADAALTYWGEITGLDPANIEARRGIARLHLAGGRADQAMSELLSIAALQEGTADIDGAIDTLRRVLDLDAGNEPAAARLIDLCLQAGRTADAIPLMMAAGEQAREAGRLAVARDHFRRVVDTDPARIAPRERLRDVLLALDRPAEAIEQLFALADLFAADAEPTRVEETLRQVLRIDPDRVEAALRLKDHYVAVGRAADGLDVLYDLAARARRAANLDAARAYVEDMLAVAADDRRALRALAEIAVDAGDTDDATRRYLQLATLAEGDRDAAAAEDYLGTVVDLDPASVEAHERLKDLLLARGNRAGAIEHLFALADLAARAGDAEAGQAYFLEVLTVEPSNESALEQLVGLLVAAGEGGRAVSYMYELGRMAHDRQDTLRAEKYLGQILDLEPENTGALELLSQVHVESGDTDRAVVELTRLEAAAEDRGDYDESLALVARILEIDGGNLAALTKKADLEDVLERTDDAVATLLRLAEAQVARDRQEDAERTLRRAQKIAPAATAVHERLVALLVAMDSPRAVIDELLRFHADAIEAGDAATIETVARRILDIDPRFERAHRLLADALLAQDRRDAAIDEIFALADLIDRRDRAAEYEARVKEIVALDELNESAHARLAALYEDQERADDLRRLRLAYADALEGAGRHQVAREVYETVLAREPHHVDALRKLKESYLATADLAEVVEVLFRSVAAADAAGQDDKAIVALEEILEHDEFNQDAFAALVARYRRAERIDRAVELMLAADQRFAGSWSVERRVDNLSEVIDLRPDHTLALRRLADLQRDADRIGDAVDTLLHLADRTADAEDVEDVLREVLTLVPGHLVVRERLADLYQERGDRAALAAELFAIARLHRDAGDADAAEESLQRAAQLDEVRQRALDELTALYEGEGQADKLRAMRLTRAREAQAAGDLAAAEQAYQEILAEDPENADARLALIELLAAHGRAAEAAGHTVMLADRARQADDAPRAIALYSRGLEYDPANRKARRQLKNLLVATGQTDQAVAQLRKLADAARADEALDDVEDLLNEILNLQPEAAKVREELIDLYLVSEQPGKAVLQMLDLADRYAAEDHPKKALAQVERAAALQPDNEPVQRRLKEAYRAAGRRDKAVATLFHLYEIDLAAKKRRGAERHLREILEIDPNNTAAKEKVVELFSVEVTDEERIADLLARAEEALEIGEVAAAERLLNDALELDPNQAEAKHRLAMLPTEERARAAATFEAPVPDDIFAVEELDESVVIDDEVVIDWGEPDAIEEAVAAVAENLDVTDAVEVDVFGETPEAAVEEIEVFADFGEAPAAGAAAEPVAEVEATPAPAIEEEPEPAIEEEPEPVIEEEPEPALDEAPEPVADEPLDFDLEPEPEPEAAAPASDSLDEYLREVDRPLDEVPPLPEAEPVVDEIGDVEMVEGLISSGSHAHPDAAGEVEPPAEMSFGSAEISSAEFLGEERPAVVEPKGHIVEDFRPFTETVPDEGFGEAARPAARSADADLISELLGELEADAKPKPAAQAASGDLLDDIFGRAGESKPAGDAFDELIGGLDQQPGKSREEADVFQSFVASLPDEMRRSSSAYTHYELGIAFREMDSIDEAISEFEKALTKDDGGLALDINHQLGQCYASLGNWDMAVEYLESALAEESADEQTVLDLTFELAVALKRLGKFAKAKQRFQEVDARSKNYRGAKAEIAECDKAERGGGPTGGDDNIGYL